MLAVVSMMLGCLMLLSAEMMGGCRVSDLTAVELTLLLVVGVPVFILVCIDEPMDLLGGGVGGLDPIGCLGVWRRRGDGLMGTVEAGD